MSVCPFMKRNAEHFREMVRQADPEELAESKAVIARHAAKNPDYLRNGKKRLHFVAEYMNAFGHNFARWWQADLRGEPPF